MLRSGLLLCAFIVLVPHTSAAQTGPEPMPRFAADVRGALPRPKAIPAIASDLSVTVDDLPTRGLGFVVGAHVYPVRTGKVTFGFGGEILRTRARRTRKAEEEDGPEGPTVRTPFSAISPQVSFNFGHRDGWSYISGGLGWASLTSEIEATGGAGMDIESARRKTINYGGGARWFAKKHIAVSLDLRFYAVSPRVAPATERGYPRMTVMVFSGGLGFR